MSPHEHAVTKTATHLTKTIQLAVLMDTTGSMASSIEQAKQAVEHLVRCMTETAQSQAATFVFEFVFVEYRDHGEDEQFLTRTNGVSNVQGAAVKFVDMHRMLSYMRQASASGGGDMPEAVEAALHVAVELPWQANATRLILLVSDAPPHGLGESGDSFPQGVPTGIDPVLMADGLAAQCIPVYAVCVQPSLSHSMHGMAFMQGVASKTGGRAFNLVDMPEMNEFLVQSARAEVDIDNMLAGVAKKLDVARAANPNMDEPAIRSLYRSLLAKCDVASVQSPSLVPSSDASSVVEAGRNLKEVRRALDALAPVPPSAIGGSGFRSLHADEYGEVTYRSLGDLGDGDHVYRSLSGGAGSRACLAGKTSLAMPAAVHVKYSAATDDIADRLFKRMRCAAAS